MSRTYRLRKRKIRTIQAASAVSSSADVSSNLLPEQIPCCIPRSYMAIHPYLLSSLWVPSTSFSAYPSSPRSARHTRDATRRIRKQVQITERQVAEGKGQLGTNESSAHRLLHMSSDHCDWCLLKRGLNKVLAAKTQLIPLL